MRRIALAAATAATLLSSPAWAEEVADLAQQYVEMPEVQAMISQMFSPETMGAQMAASLPPNITLTPEQQAAMGVVMSEAMNTLRPRMEEMMVTNSAAMFSAPELRALIDFYQSEHGASVMTKMSAFMTNIMSELAPEMQAMQQEVTPQIVEILQGG